MEQELKELEDKIFKATSKKFGEDYGFILGTKTPLMEKGTTAGFFSVVMVDGFKVWKKLDGAYDTTILTPENYEDSLNKIIEYLNIDNK